jgi:Zn-dependent peptidase ImmA (M78 family)
MVTAEEIAALFGEARAAWSIDDASLAARAGLDQDALPAVLRGEADLSDLAAVARALGGSLDDVIHRRRFWEAPAVAFKSAPSTVELPLVRAALLRVSAAARDRAMLADVLALPEPMAGEPALAPVPVAEAVTAQAEELAGRARQALGSASEPIASVRDAMRRLGVWTFLTDFATEDVDGMMWRDEAGRACAAANVRARGGKLTALRMTFAHELCHAVFDGTKQRPFGLVEDRSDRGGREQRANAFAAHFLAPRDAVLRFLRERGLREHDKPSAVHLRALTEHFGMGVEAMAGHLVTCRLWSKSDMLRHRALVTRDARGEDNAEVFHTPAEERVPLERRGDILELASLALDRGAITVARWRELLDLGPLDGWRALLDEQQVDRDVENRSAL